MVYGAGPALVAELAPFKTYSLVLSPDFAPESRQLNHRERRLRKEERKVSQNILKTHKTPIRK